MFIAMEVNAEPDTHFGWADNKKKKKKKKRDITASKSLKSTPRVLI